MAREPRPLRDGAARLVAEGDRGRLVHADDLGGGLHLETAVAPETPLLERLPDNPLIPDENQLILISEEGQCLDRTIQDGVGSIVTTHDIDGEPHGFILPWSA